MAVDDKRWAAFGLVAAWLLVATIAARGLAQPPDGQVSESERDHWAFRPVQRPPLPPVKDASWPHNGIDTFVLAKLESRGWQPNPPADDRALLRRVFLDLVGLPPTLKQQQQWLNQTATTRVDDLVDELLCRPGYGERWGRHWLDLVRYAETNGYERDAAKPHVWRYRDYVIRAFNEDTPYDRFVLEQLAGDELADASSQTIIATGYYRLGPWDDEPADFAEDRFDQLDDMLNTTSQVFLGLTLACARCHDHKFEPLTQFDYYRMIAVFNTLERPRNGRTDLDLPAGTRAQLAAQQQRDAAIAQTQSQMSAMRAKSRDALLAGAETGLPDEVVAAFRTAEKDRSEQQQKIVSQRAAEIDRLAAARLNESDRKQVAELQKRITRLRHATPDLPRGYFMQEKSPDAPATHLLKRGKAASPGPRVEPGVPAVLVAKQPEFLTAGAHTSQRRLALARWIADRQNPLTARTIVNRVWQFHFGQGLVRTPSDFGLMGEPPTHPELLEWLTDWFVNEAQWSVKRLHRLIMTSNTYRMSRISREDYAEQDPENRFLWRHAFRRLEVEAIRDSMLSVSGRLDSRMYGPAMYPYVPRDAMLGHSDPDKIWPEFNESAASRRTVYAFVKRSLVVPFLEVLDLCDTTKSTAQRNRTNVAPQALTLLNGEFVNRQARHFADRLQREAGDDPRQRIRLAYQLALCRLPAQAEEDAMLAFLKAERKRLRAVDPQLAKDQADRRALVQLCRVVFNLNEFVFPD